MFRNSQTTLLANEKCDVYRLYEDIPGVAGWREMRDPIFQSRHWRHVGMRLTTWSLQELIRYGGLEEMLLIGEWGLFMHQPEEITLYEDVEWHTSYFDNVDLEGEPIGHLQRGALVASLGMPRPGVTEMLIPDDSNVVRLCYTPYRFPNENGKRLLLKLPAREQNEDAVALHNVTSGEFRVLAMPWIVDGSGDFLTVTEKRDPRSNTVGTLRKGMVVSLSIIVGTRAQISRINEQTSTNMLGGWVSIFTLDGAPLMERLLYETENMREMAAFKKYLTEAEARIEAGANDNFPLSYLSNNEPPPTPKPWVKPIIVHMQAEEEGPGYQEKHPPVEATQRETLTGGWRQIIDPVWKKFMFSEPISGCFTWRLADVMRTGGLEDLLLSRTWHISVIDPLLVELMKKKDWTCSVYPDSGMGGEPVLHLPKGTFVICKHFDTFNNIAALLLPPSEKNGAPISGYAKYRANDGRPIFRSLLKYPEEVEAFSQDGEPILAQEPDFDVLEGPFEVIATEDGCESVSVTEEQDMFSDSSHYNPLVVGYQVKHFEGREGGFAEVVGTRARLPSIAGGGWVSLFTKYGRPLFRKDPAKPPAEQEVSGFGDRPDAKLGIHIPVIWHHHGAVDMPKLGDPGFPEKYAKPEVVLALPTALEKLRGGRGLCDWNRFTMEGAVAASSAWSCWKSPLMHIKTTLDELLALQVWKIVVAEIDLSLREQVVPQSRQLTTIRRGSVLVAEWVSPTNAVRILVPETRNDERPRHLWTDMDTSFGSSVLPLVPGGEFWVEPKGGHLSDEEQLEENLGDPTELVLRETKDPSSKRIVGLRRADVVQIAELEGRFARVIVTYRLGIAEMPPGGWIEVFDESGWSQLQVRYPGVMHPLQIQAEGLAEFPTPREIIGEPREPPVVELQKQEAPALLQQIGELEESSTLARDWHEQVDPVWGRRYYVNRWSGQVIHSLAAAGVYAVAVRLTLWFTNLTLTKLEHDPIQPGSLITEDEAWSLKLQSIENNLKEPFASMVDAPVDMLAVNIVDGPNTGGTDGDDAMEDSIKSRGALDVEADQLPRFRIVATISSPNEHASWAAAMLKQDMANAEKFNAVALSVVGAVPELQRLKISNSDVVQLAQANLEELDVAPWERPPTPPPPVDPPPPIDDDFHELRKNLRYARPKILDYKSINPAIRTPDVGRHMALGNFTAVADGLELALRDHKPFLEEIHLWDKGLVDYHMQCLLEAFVVGCMSQLTTVLLDDNKIGPVGAQALSKGLKNCLKLRELSVAQNPIGIGFLDLVKCLRPSLVVLNAMKADITDVGAVAAGQALPGWPNISTLRLRGNKSVGVHGAEAVARGALANPSLKLADLQDTAAKPWEGRISRVLADAGTDASRVRV